MGRRSIGFEAVANQLYGRLAGACGDGGLVDWPAAGGWDLAGCWLRAGAFNVRRMLRLVCHLRSPVRYPLRSPLQYPMRSPCDCYAAYEVGR